MLERMKQILEREEILLFWHNLLNERKMCNNWMACT